MSTRVAYNFVSRTLVVCCVFEWVFLSFSLSESLHTQYFTVSLYKSVHCLARSVCICINVAHRKRICAPWRSKARTEKPHDIYAFRNCRERPCSTKNRVYSYLSSFLPYNKMAMHRFLLALSKSRWNEILSAQTSLSPFGYLEKGKNILTSKLNLSEWFSSSVRAVLLQTL